MPEEINPAQEQKKAPDPSTTSSELRVKVIPYPKVVFFWPTWIFSLLCGVLSMMGGIQPWVALVFLTVFSFNMFIISFEFNRIKFIATGMAFIIIIMSLFLAQAWEIQIFSFLKNFIQKIDVQANHEFYFAISIVFLIIYTVVFISTKWNYWVIEPNEVLHYHGFMGDVHRYPAPQLKMSKEITDIFEYCLLFSGTLILSPTSESRDIVLENVLFVNKKEERIKNLLGAIQVKIRH